MVVEASIFDSRCDVHLQPRLCYLQEGISSVAAVITSSTRSRLIASDARTCVRKCVAAIVSKNDIMLRIDRDWEYLDSVIIVALVTVFASGKRRVNF